MARHRSGGIHRLGIPRQRTGHRHMIDHFAKARTQGAIPSAHGRRGGRRHGGLAGHEERRARGYARAHFAGAVKRRTGLPGRRGHL